MSHWPSSRVAVLVHALLLTWMVIGPQRAGGQPGWIAFLLTLASPVLLVLLSLPTFLGHRLLRRRGLPLSPAQLGAQAVVWLGMVGVGCFRSDAGDVGGLQVSLVTTGTGLDPLLSETSALGSALVGAAAWVTLVVLLLLDRRHPTGPLPPSSAAIRDVVRPSAPADGRRPARPLPR